MAMSAAALLVAACAAPLSWAEVHNFNGAAVPDAGVLEGRFLFYVHSLEDSPGPKVAESKLMFKDIRLRKENGDQAKDLDVAIGVLPWSEYANLLDSKTVCGNEGGKFTPAFKDHASKQHAHWHLAKSPANEDASYTLGRSGPYLLVVANCGSSTSSSTKLSLYGSVVVKNPYGYAAGNDYLKPSLYGWALLGYTVVLFAWGAHLFVFMRSSDTKREFHTAITHTLCAGLMECAFSLAFYIQANNTELSSEESNVLMFAQICGVVKLAYLLRLFRAVSSGDVSCKEQAIGSAVLLLYVAAATLNSSLQSFRHAYAIDGSIWTFCLFATAIAGFVALVWVMRGLARMMQRSREVSDDKMLARYQHTTLLALVLVVSSVAVWGAQYLDVPGQSFTEWYYHTLVQDAAPQAIAFGGLLVMIYLWKPSEDIRPLYNVAEDGEVIGLTEDTEAPTGKAAGMPAEPVQFVLDDDDDHPAGKNGVPPQAIGSTREQGGGGAAAAAE